MARMPKLDTAFTIIYVVLTISVITTELIGVARKAKGDTITEHWKWVDKWLAFHSPVIDWVWRGLTIAGLLILIPHLMPDLFR